MEKDRKMSINKCFLVGNLTRDMDVAYTSTGTPIGNFGIAVNDRRKNNRTGEWEDCPNFIECTLFGTRSEKLEQYLTKGTKVSIDGKLHWSQWEKDGQKRSKIEVFVDNIELMGGRSKSNQSDEPPSDNDFAPSIYDDEIPF